MQTRITRYVIVGLMAVSLMGVGLIKETQAQWASVASPYHVNVGPNYVAWRPFGGLFVGLHNGLHNLLCHRCWCSPCRCVVPMYYDPCPTPCFDPCCDPCCDSCFDSCGTTFGGFVGDSCGCSTRFGYFSSTSQSGIPSPTGFGTVTPVDGVPGQRSPAAQRPALPATGRQTIRTPDNTFQQPVNEPTKAPAQDVAPIQPEDINSRLDGIGRRGQFNDAANVPPTTDFDGAPTTSGTGTTSWYGNSPAGTGAAAETAAPAGEFPRPAGITQPGANEPQNQGGGSTNNMMNLGSGVISVTVPEHSKVFINGYETKITGVNRRYVVNDLEPGQSYQYEICIIADIAGQLVEETQNVTLSGGQQSMIAFGKGQRQFVGESNAYLAARPAR